MTNVACAIYARISSDPNGQALGVGRQIEDCEAEAGRRGWTVARTYVDNDVSATRSNVRPEYRHLLADIRSGAIGALIVWDVDRLTRTPRELEDVIDLADRHGLALASIGGEIDLATPQGRMTARIKGSVARHETEQQSRRIRRKFQEAAQAGEPHGQVAYGYRREVTHDDQGNRVSRRDVIDTQQADVIRRSARAVLGGRSLRSVVTELNGQGVPSPRGGTWSSTQLRQILLRDRNAGLRVYQGQVLGPGIWPPVYDIGTHEQVVATLSDPGRQTNRGSTRVHLLTGIARCGRDGCDGRMIVNKGRVQPDGHQQPPAYTCRQCTRVRRKQAAVDELVSAVIVGRLQQPDALAALSSGDPAEVEQARANVATLEARLALAADDYADGALTGDQLRRITERLRPQIEAARATITANMPTPWVAGMAGLQAAERWEAAPLDVRRALIELLCEVTILPLGSGRMFDPASVRIEWKGDAK